MAFRIFRAATFDRELAKYPADVQMWVDKMEQQLAENPFAGDPLRVPWFREKKKNKYRLYYLIYEDLRTVFMVGISERKTNNGS